MNSRVLDIWKNVGRNRSIVAISGGNGIVSGSMLSYSASSVEKSWRIASAISCGYSKGSVLSMLPRLFFSVEMKFIVSSSSSSFSGIG